MTYDPGERRDTPLALKLKERIRRRGPISIAEYMRACLQDADHGYYRTRRAVGAGGDFITAPEISQVFGELIGLWCAVVWQQMGAPARVNLVELGPGRGTLMRDALRAARVASRFLAAAQVHLLDINPALIKAQRIALADAITPLRWHAGPETVPAGPAIIVANEWLDAQPLHQDVQMTGGWLSRAVGLDGDGRLQFAVEGGDGLAELRQPIRERRDPDPVVTELLDPTRPSPRAALFLDYGPAEPSVGDTLQAVRNNAPEHPLCSPGEADLSAHVDFAGLRKDFEQLDGLAVDGPVTQAEFLGALGVVERASRLMAANPAKAALVESSVARLMAPAGMGARFKAIGVRSAHLPPLPGFPTLDKSPAGA